MKKLLLIFITAVVGLVAHAGITVYYDNSDTQFSPMKLQYWGNGFGANNQNMTPVEGSIYKFDLPDNTTGCLFYNGYYNNGNQTENVEPPTHNHLYKGTKGTNDKCTVTDEDVYPGSSEPDPNTYTIYFYAPDENAIDVYCHIWTESDGNITTWESCPKMDDTGKYVKIGNDYHKAYSYTFVTTKTPASILFKKGTGNSDKFNDNCRFVNGMFYHAVDNSGVCNPETQSLVDKGGVDPDPTPDVDGYYVYFVNKNNWGSVNIWAWNESDNNLTNASGWPGDVMELVSGNTYIWRLPEGEGVPTNVKFSNGGANATDDLVFKNHATYYPDGSIVEEIVRGANILYCHFKTDRVRRTNGNESAIPRCHVFGNGAVQLTKWGTDAEKMTKIDDPTDENGEGKGGITARYELWKYEIPVEEFQSGKYNNAVFYVAENDEFNNESKTSKWQISNGWGENRNNYLKENWTKYIYATCEIDDSKVKYAVPSYVTPSEFLTLHQKNVVEKGRDGIFIVGPKNNFTYKDAATGDWLQLNNFDPTDQRRLTPDDGVFYLQVQPNENGGNMFKLSWMDVLGQKNTAETREGGASSVNEKLAHDRNWATFDLGCIGIDTKLVPGGDYAENEGPAGRVTFQLNRPYKYTNNNACDWFISGSTSESRWIILDTHYDSTDENYQCESVTITDFNPHPTLTAEFTTFETAGVLPADLDPTKTPEPHLYACEANGGHIVNLKFNYAHAQATIGASTTNEKFTRNYEIKYDDKNVADIPGTISSFKYDYYPVNVSGSSLKIRARYKDNDSGLRFHSLTSDGKPGNLQYQSNKPTGTALDAKYIEEECKVTYKTDGEGNQLLDEHKKPIVEKVERTFGVLVPNFNINIESSYVLNGNTSGELGAYADYQVFDENGKEITEKCKLFTGTGNAHMIECIKLNYGNNAYDNYCWNWSEGTHWAQALKEEPGSASLYFGTINKTPVADITDLKDRTYTIVLQAVYPLVYQKNPTLVASASEANGEPVAKTAADPTSPEYVISHVRKTLPIKVTVLADKNTVTGVDDVFGDAEADNADAPAEYYTISGVRVNGDLAPGIYVVRRGNKVTKEVVK